MRSTKVSILTVLVVCAMTAIAQAQPPGGGQGRPGGPQGGGQRGGPQGGSSNSVIGAIDADGNHEISAREIMNAAAALKKLDRNRDGKLTSDEIHGGGGQQGGRGMRGGGPPGGQGGGPPGQGGGQHGHGGPPQGGAGPGGPPNGVIAQLMKLDRNKDQKLSKTELPRLLRGLLETNDTNKDGFVALAELEAHGEQHGAGGGQRGGPPGGGPPEPAQFVEHAMTFDTDKDGKLSQIELKKMAAQMAQGPRGGHGGPPGQGQQRGGAANQIKSSRPGSDK